MPRKKERRRGNRRRGPERHQRAKAVHDSQGEWDAIRIPEGLEHFKPEAKKTYHIDVIPYIVGPKKVNKAADEGDEYYELSYPIYNNIGIDEKRFIAIGELLGVPDPVAEHFMSLRRANAEWEDMKSFKHTWRQLMLIFVHEQADKGLQLFEGAYGSLGELLAEELDGEGGEGGEGDYVNNFDDPDAGATLEVRFKEKNIGKSKPWVLASKINFHKREDGFDADGDEDLADKILGQAAKICLDDALKVPTYEALRNALHGVPDRSAADAGYAPSQEPEPEPEAPTAKELGFKRGATVEHQKHGVCLVVRCPRSGTLVNIADAAGTTHKDIDVSALTLSDKEYATADDDERTPEPAEPAEPKAPAEPAAQAAAEPEEPEPAASESSDEDWDEDW